jgi:hypothetical protein
MSLWQKKPAADTTTSQEDETFTCPTCALVLRSSLAGGGVTLDYDIAQWQKTCVSARSGTPCLCPDFRPHLWQMLTRANKR